MTAVLACAVLLAGCSPTSPVDGTAPAPITQPREIRDDLLVPDLPVGTVIASGVSGPGTAFSGTVEIVTTKDGGYQLRLLSIDLALEEPDQSDQSETTAEVLLSALPLGSELRCDDQHVVPVGHAGGNPSEPIPLGDFHDFGQYDPSFLTEVVIAERVGPGTDENACMRTVLARVPLTWMFPVLRSDLLIHDNGSAMGARGEIIRESGEAVSYVVAPGDILSEIVDRLDITLQDFLWLNPFSAGDMAYEGDIYNLDRDARHP